MVEDIRNAIINQAQELLGEDVQVVRTDPTGKNFTLCGQEHINNVATYFRGAQLLVDQYTIRYVGDATFYRQDLYAFYPDHTDHIINNSAYKRDRRGMELTFPGPSEIVIPAQPTELSNILEKITHSQPFTPSP